MPLSIATCQSRWRLFDFVGFFWQTNPTDPRIMEANGIAHHGLIALDMALFSLGLIPEEYKADFQNFYRFDFSAYVNDPERLEALIKGGLKLEEQIAALVGTMSGYGSFTSTTVSVEDDAAFEVSVEFLHGLIAAVKESCETAQEIEHALEELAAQEDVIEKLANMRMIEQRTRRADKIRRRYGIFANA